MPNYQKMYTTLFNIMTDVIKELQQAQRKTEEIFIAEPNLQVSIVPDCESKTE